MRDLSRNVQITKQYESPETSPGRPNDHDGSLMFTSAAAHKHDGRTNERRSCNREPLQWAVLVFFGDNWGKLIDLSEKGMCFQFAHAPIVPKEHQHSPLKWLAVAGAPLVGSPVMF